MNTAGSISGAWRFITSGLSNGPWNMAIDEALVSSFDPENDLPVFRVYGWYPATLSLGRFQKVDDEIDLDCCRRLSIPLVRRITGGGAILHADELTYSIVCAPHHIPASRSVKDSFRILTGFLLEFYRALHLQVSYAEDTVGNSERLGERTSFCSAGKESFDILIQSKKIGGNAQRRWKEKIFQHGSIPIINSVTTGLSLMKKQSTACVDRVTSLAEWGVIIDMMQLQTELENAFTRYFHVNLFPGQLNRKELACAENLLRHKYATDSWNLDGMEL